MGNLSSFSSKNSTNRDSVRHVIVAPDQAGQRLDNFLLRELKGLPRSRVYRLVRKGEVRVNLGRVKARYRLQSGDEVRIPPVRLGAASPAAAPADLDTGAVLYEDEHLLVLDKPAGVAVHGGTGLAAGVIEALRARRPELAFLELVHRLDRATSGCLMLAKSGQALRALHASLRREAAAPIVKRYTALVAGNPGPEPVHVQARLARRAGPGGERIMAVSQEGDPAESVFRTEAGGPVCSRVGIELVTGRTHQARVHAAHIGHPIAGDLKYGEREFNERMRRAGLKRLALHASELELSHPVTGEALRIRAPLPEVFSAAQAAANE